MKHILNDEQKELATKLIEARMKFIIRFYMDKKDLSEKDKYEKANYVLIIATNDSKESEEYITLMADRKTRIENKDKLLPLSTTVDIRFYQAVHELWAFYNGKDKCLDILDFSHRVGSDKPVNNELLEAVRDFSREIISEFNHRRSVTNPLARETKENNQSMVFSPPISSTGKSYVNLVTKQREEESKENDQPPLGYSR